MDYSFQALGTTWWIEIWDEVTDNTRAEIIDFCSGVVTTYEHNYSRFKPDSLLSQLNRDRVLDNPSKELIDLLQYGKQLYLRTDTVFNFLTGHILEARGYDAAYSFTDSGASKLVPGNPITDLTISPERIELQHGNIDLGGYGKGYLIDLLAEQFKTRFNLKQFLINGGGDMYATHEADQPIEIHLQDPITKKLVGRTMLRNCAFASSSPHLRSWPAADGTSRNHIVTTDIQPVQSLALDSVKDVVYLTAPTATDADAFATTALQLNQQDLERLAKSENLGVALFDTKTNKLVANQTFT